MKSKPIFLTDLDGVSLDWLKGFTNYMEHELGHKAEHLLPKHFTMVDIYKNLEKPYLHVKDFQQSEYYKDIKPYEGAVEAYQTLHEMGVEIIAVTACGEEKQAQKYRQEHIDKYFGNFIQESYFLPLGSHKKDILNKFKNATFIDDQTQNAQDAAELGLKSFLWNMSYNENDDINHENLKRAYAWTDVISSFKLDKSHKKTKKIKP